MNILEHIDDTIVEEVKEYERIMKEIQQMTIELNFRLPRKTKKKFKEWLLINQTFEYTSHDHKYYKKIRK